MVYPLWILRLIWGGRLGAAGTGLSWLLLGLCIACPLLWATSLSGSSSVSAPIQQSILPSGALNQGRGTHTVSHLELEVSLKPAPWAVPPRHDVPEEPKDRDVTPASQTWPTVWNVPPLPSGDVTQLPVSDIPVTKKSRRAPRISVSQQ